MKRRCSFALLSIVLLTVTCICAIGAVTASRSSNQLLIASTVRQGDHHWQLGEYSNAIRSWTEAAFMVPDAEVRWLLAGFYFNQMSQEQDAGDLKAALDSCRRSVKMPGRYDPEGSQSYVCFTIDERIRMLDRCQHECEAYCPEIGVPCTH
jgi:hypothetical protein